MNDHIVRIKDNLKRIKKTLNQRTEFKDEIEKVQHLKRTLSKLKKS